jgi:hypothetical protein
MLKHIKVIQQKELHSWQGLEILYTQRPGKTSLLTNTGIGTSDKINNKKESAMTTYFKLEDERFKFFIEQMNRYRD